MSSTEQTGRENEEPGLTQLLQALLSDRQEERCLERVRHEQELSQHQEERRVQMDLIRTLLERATPATPRQPQPDILFKKLTETDDIEAYLTTFEWLVMSASLERQHRAFKLAPYLTGKAQQAYAALSSEEAADYTKLKEAILHRYNVTVDSYRQQFRATFKKPRESYQELMMS